MEPRVYPGPRPTASARPFGLTKPERRGYGTASMATFAVGDIQGCHQALQRLLERASFNPVTDRLWLTGDLVNRGPDSLAVLRWVRRLRDRTIVVLRNHDLHLLAVASGAAAAKRCDDTLLGVLEAPDPEELLDL